MSPIETSLFKRNICKCRQQYGRVSYHSLSSLIAVLAFFLASTSRIFASYNLSKEIASSRAKLISNVDYKLSVNLEKESLSYSGQSEIQFDFSKTDSKALESSLRVDFYQGSVESVRVNQTSIETKYQNERFILIPTQGLKNGRNTVSIRFERKFSSDGSGFHRFKDPKDGRVYVYTDLEPNHATRVFPLFDQPDLKATYTLSVTAPSNWEVVAAVTGEKTIEGRKALWSFPRSERFSSYIFALHAGPWKIWKDSVKSRKGKIPLRVLARQSLAKHVDPQNWFKLTKQGFKFFEEFFDQEFPYSKYDQLLVPEFNWGGMENIGAVTYNERYVFRTPPRQTQRIRRANTILHELAHMWFGNLVTMKWWNGLWLNESFATVMAHLALEKGAKFPGVWETFFLRTKQWAYWEDQLVTTHPIELPVPDTETAFTQFDGITYGKGASVLKQLIFLLGDDFELGIQQYFKKFAGGNTTLADFFNSFPKGKISKKWIKDWLNTSGLNTIQSEYQCKDGKVTEFKLKQSGKPLRTHRTRVGIYKDNNLIKRVDVTYSKANTVISDLIGATCPDMVYPNIDDFDYVKVQLDQKTLKTIQRANFNIKDDFLRGMVWTNLWDMTRDAKWSLIDFVDYSIARLSKEKNRALQEKIARLLAGSAYQYLSYFSKGKQREIEEFVLGELLRAPAKSDQQGLWFDLLLKTDQVSSVTQKIEDLYENKIELKGFELSEQRQWKILRNLAKRGSKRALQFGKSLYESSKTDLAAKNWLAVQAAVPNPKTKSDWLQRIIDLKSKDTLAQQEEIMSELFTGKNRSLALKHRQTITNSFSKLQSSKNIHFVKTYVNQVWPNRCDRSDSKSVEKLAKKKIMTPGAVKSLRIWAQENRRCHDIIELSSRDLKPGAVL